MGSIKTYRRAASRKLPKLLKKTNNTCYWCGCEIILLRKIPLHKIIDIRHFEVEYKEGSKDVCKSIASVDHKVALLSHGHPTNIDNLVASCKKCNENRGREAKQEYFKWLNQFDIGGES